MNEDNGQHLRIVNVAWNEIDNDGARYLADSLKLNRVKPCFHLLIDIMMLLQILREMDLADNKIEADGIRFIAESLKTNRV